MARTARLFLFALGIVLIVVALAAPRALFSIGELCAGAILIGIGFLLFVPSRKKGVALKDLPWIKAANNDSDSDSSAGA